MEDRDYHLTEACEEFLNDYYRKEIAELAQHYPQEQRSVYVEAKDIYRFDPDLLDKFTSDPEDTQRYFNEALNYAEIPLDIDLSDARVRVTDTHGYIDRVGVGELTKDHIEKYVALTGQIDKVTGRMTRIRVAAFNCQSCPGVTEVPQPLMRTVEPHQCTNCDTQGPFNVDYSESELQDQRKVKITQPPENQVNGTGEEIVGYVFDDLIDIGGANGLQDRAGSRVTILGTLKVDDTDLFEGRTSEPIPEEYFIPHAFVFDDSQDEEIDVSQHKEEIEEYANRDNAIDLFKDSIDPGLTVTDKWDIATEMATAYLFGAPRIDPPEGDMIRGDIHMLFVSDPGMRKSVFADKVAEISPQCELRQATGMASDVGLTSAAQQDDFGDGKWSLKPGALPRANGGHLILDEIDKGPGLGGIHDALEGAQELKVDKAGIQATLATRVGFMALGNPTEGRFDPHQPIPEQIDLDPALMSRFDLIVTMEDTPDESQDDAIAGGILDTVDESARLEYGELDSENADTVTPDVPREVMKAWVKYARENIQPLLTDKAKGILRQFYVDTRQLNGEDAETPPATARTLMAGIRLSMAFARAELSDTVEAKHAKRAKRLSKNVVGENFDADTGEFDADRTTETPSSQQQRVNAIQQALRRADEPLTVDEIVEETDIDESKVRHRIDKLYQNGRVVQPSNGEYRWA